MYIYTTNNIERTSPLLHGSGKKCIKVFNYKENTGVKKHKKKIVKHTDKIPDEHDILPQSSLTDNDTDDYIIV
jgi:hypothetical protein